jgi:hypothetical protein
MLLRDHIKYSFVLFLILVWFLKIKALYIFIASILIDLDHYLDFAIKNQNLSLSKMFKYHEELFEFIKNNPYFGISLFHTVEFMALLIILSIFNPFFSYILFGTIFHLLLDSIYLYHHKCLSKRAFSIVQYILRKRV